MAFAPLTLSSLVRDLLHGQGEAGEHLVARFTNLALSALQLLSYTAPAATATRVRLTIGPRREVQVPDELAMLLRVSGQAGDYLVPLVPDDRVGGLPATDAASVIDADSDGLTAGSEWPAPWAPGAGSYRYSPDERLLRFAAGMGTDTTVEVEFLPAVNICGNDTPLSELVREPVGNYVLWKYTLSKNNIGAADRYERYWRRGRDTYRLQHTSLHPLTVARLSDEGAARGPR